MRRRPVLVLALCGLALPGPAASAAGAKRPNLKIAAVTATPATVAAGGALSVAPRVANSERPGAGAFTVAVFLSVDAARSRDDVRLGSVAVRRLKGRTATSLRATLRVPASIAARDYALIACADSGGRVRERRENDNCRAAARRITVLTAALPAPTPTPSPSVTPEPTPTPAPACAPDGTPDTDADGLPDRCDDDDDNDTVLDAADNCALIANASQLNTDADAQGDACDPDDDGDGVADPDDCAPLDPARPGAYTKCYTPVTAYEINQGLVATGSDVLLTDMTLIARHATTPSPGPGGWAHVGPSSPAYSGAQYAALELFGALPVEAAVGSPLTIRGTLVTPPSGGNLAVATDEVLVTGVAGAVAPVDVTTAVLIATPAAYDNELVRVQNVSVTSPTSQGFTINDGIVVRHRADATWTNPVAAA